jgi:SAM-dependent methyltransferase
MSQYDLELFLKLNAEWDDRPLVARPRAAKDPIELTQQSRQRASWVAKHIPLRGKRVLEIGCGRGFFVRLLTDEYDCDATGIDVVSYPEWRGERQFVQADIASPPTVGDFDVIVSHAVWEHVEHPYTALVNQRAMLAPDGAVYLYANLYRGAKASHRYREVKFPWPHLLFTDDVFQAFYEHIGQPPRRAAWVNRLTFAQYVDHFERIGYGIRRVWPSRPWWDEAFYRQHWDVLGRYPEWDLRHDFIHAVLSRDPDRGQVADLERDAYAKRDAEQRRRIRQLEGRIATLESSRSWRLTAPLRAAGRLLRSRS